MTDRWQSFAREHLRPLFSDQAKLYQRLEGKIDAEVLQRAKRDAMDESDVKTIIAELHKCAQTQEEAEAGRRSVGHRPVVSKIKIFANWADKFFIAFSGIAQIAKAIDQHYGGIAYGTLSLFLMVVRNKELHNALTFETLEGIGSWLPRLDVISKVEKENETVMQFVFEVYSEIVGFLRDATEYFTRNWIVRTCKIVVKPPDQYLMRQAEGLKEKTRNLLEELFLVQYDQLCRMKQHLSCVVENTDQTNKRLAEEQSECHQERLRTISRKLDFPTELTAGPETMAQDCAQIYAGKFIEHRDRAASSPIRLKNISLGALAERPQYNDWMRFEASSLLILSGENFSYNASESWLSPVAVEFYHSVSNVTNISTMFHSINALKARRRKDPETEVLLLLKSVLYQLFELRPKLCQIWHDSIAEECGKSATTFEAQDPLDEQIGALFIQFVKVLSSDADDRHVYYILLDGLERLSAPAPETLLAGFLDVLDNHEMKVKVKMLVTCDFTTFQNKVRGPGDMDGLRYALGQGGNRQAMNRVFCDFWNQPQLERNS